MKNLILPSFGKITISVALLTFCWMIPGLAQATITDCDLYADEAGGDTPLDIEWSPPSGTTLLMAVVYSSSSGQPVCGHSQWQPAKETRLNCPSSVDTGELHSNKVYYMDGNGLISWASCIDPPGNQ